MFDYVQALRTGFSLTLALVSDISCGPQALRIGFSLTLALVSDYHVVLRLYVQALALL